MQNQDEQVLQAHGQRGHGNAPSEAPYRSPAERRAEGKRLRDAVPRAEHKLARTPRRRSWAGAAQKSMSPRHPRSTTSGRIRRSVTTSL
jgi:hypothetical protein